MFTRGLTDDRELRTTGDTFNAKIAKTAAKEREEVFSADVGAYFCVLRGLFRAWEKSTKPTKEI